MHEEKYIKYKGSSHRCKLHEALGLGLHELDQIDDPVAVAELVVVPGHQLDEGGGELDASLGIKDGRTSISQEVGGDNHVLGIAQNACI